ncbi:LysR substrate-binding domain-containing protein [Niallia sp. Krafla_26]|uniref:LysR substrate-binding domain-containing protein n=1 Tax=Niallia sp. Krafla_26 TaxID=3064703 RepID=UPI003D179DF7
MDKMQIETFLKIVKSKSFSKAADELKITQPTVTARIKNLENELNCKLFKKEGKDMVVTKEGDLFIEYASKILHYMNQSINVIDQSKTPIIHVGFCPGLASSFMIETIGTLKNDLTLSITEGEDSDVLMAQVKRGELDLIFVRNLVSTDPELVSELLFEDKFVLIMGTEHRLVEKESVTLDDLMYETLICYSPTHPVWQKIDQKLKGITDLHRIQVKNNDTLKTFVKNNWGISFSPSLGIDENEMNKIISKEMREISDIPNEVYVVYRKNAPTEKYIKKMVYSFINHGIVKSKITV